MRLIARRCLAITIEAAAETAGPHRAQALFPGSRDLGRL